MAVMQLLKDWISSFLLSVLYPLMSCSVSEVLDHFGQDVLSW